MKNKLVYTFAFCLAALFSACDESIDSITEVDPGPDAGAPLVTISKPVDGFEIQVAEPVTSTPIEFRAEDDIELASVAVTLDGQMIASYDSFIDYRIFIEDFVYDNITTGDHVLQVSATDIVGNTTVAISNFSKEPPYTPLFPGETFYMNFDGSYSELVTSTDAAEVGNPGFAAEPRVGSGAYSGATDSYLTFPIDGLLASEFSAAFWYNLNNDPDRAGILTIGPEDVENANYPDTQNNRNSGFRFFREARAGNQSFRLNVGNGTGAVTAIPDAAVDLDGTEGWVHFAFSITQTNAVIYLNGVEIANRGIEGLDWTGCDIISIMSGAPHFTGWNHRSDLSAMDDLRLFNMALDQNDVIELVAQSDEVFKLSFNGSYTEFYSDEDCTEVGNPGFTGSGSGFDGDSYQGAEASYLTFPTEGLLTDEFSAVFDYKVNASPDRAGILVIGPPDSGNADFPDTQNLRTNGFRLFRENAAGMQRIKLNVGNGTADSWFDGGAAADIDPNANQWVQIAFTISDTECVVYIDGQVVSQNDFTGVDWTDCDIMSIMSGAPRFTGWNHLSDQSAMDNLRIYKKALSQAEVQSML